MGSGYGSGGNTGAVVILLDLGSQVLPPILITFFLLTRFPKNESKNKQSPITEVSIMYS